MKTSLILRAYADGTIDTVLWSSPHDYAAKIVRSWPEALALPKATGSVYVTYSEFTWAEVKDKEAL